jgi:heme exporter protein A
MATPAVVAAGLGRRFVGRWAVRDVSIEVPAGALLLLHGPNGAGKTTLVRLLASALSPTEGKVAVFGCEPREVRSRMALLSHADGHYDELSARDNLEQARQLGRLRGSVDEVLQRVGLGHRQHDPVRQYSAGMRKRLAFARLLLKAPELALLDEPYAALDAEGHALVDTLFRELHEAGTTLVVSTHQVHRLAPLCTHHAELGAGRLVAFGPQSPLAASQPVSAAASVGAGSERDP